MSNNSDYYQDNNYGVNRENLGYVNNNLNWYAVTTWTNCVKAKQRKRFWDTLKSTWS